MTILFFDGFEGYDSLSAEPSDNTLANTCTVAVIGSSEVLSGALGGAASGCRLHAALSGSYTKKVTVDKSVTPTNSLCVSATITLNSETGINRLLGVGSALPSDNGGTYTSGALVYADPDRQLILRGFPSGQSNSTGYYLVDDHDYHIELETLSDGTVNLYVTDALVASINRGGTDNLSVAGLGGRVGAGVTRANYYFDHFIVSDARVGPAIVIPIPPSSDSVVSNDFSPVPDDGTKWDKVNDVSREAGTDLDATYIEAAVSNAEQVFSLASSESFSGEALAYQFSSSSKVANPSPYRVETFIVTGGTEEVLDSRVPSTGTYSIHKSGTLHQLPGGLPLSQANFEASEVGVRLIKL